MKDNETSQVNGLTASGVALVATQIFRLMFGGYTIGLDHFHYNDPESAMSVLVIYGIIGVLTILFLMGKRKYGIYGLIAISVLLLVLQSIYIVAYFSQSTINPNLHSPLAFPLITGLKYVFPLLTILFAYLVSREINT